MKILAGYNLTVPFHWAGGKKWMAAIIAGLLPETIHRLLIPFFGRGDFLRLLRNLGIEVHALISDINTILMATHQGTKENPGEVVRLLLEHQALHSPEYFLRVRDSIDLNGPKAASAASFMYVMNGSYKACLKQSKSGSHANVSARRSVSCQPAAIYAHSIALRNTSLFIEDFAAMIMRARKGDFVLLDPPYLAQMGYGNILFSKADHIRLHAGCLELHRRGACFLLTSSDDAFIRDLYKDFSIQAVEVSRGLGVKRHATELIITNY